MKISKAITAMPKQQRAAAKYLVGFFAVMALLTFLSRAADSFTVPRVTTEKFTGGALEYKVISEGSLHPVAQVPVFAPPGYRIIALHAEQGSWVAAGDKLAELDISQMQTQLDVARAELQKLNLSAAANALNTPDKTDESAIVAAKRAIERALADLKTAEREARLRVEIASGDVYAARRVLRELRDMDEVFDMELYAARDAVRKQEQALEEACLAEEKALEAARRAIEDAEIELEQEKANAKRASEVSAADSQRKVLERQVAYVDVELAQQKVNELESLLKTGGIIMADNDGVVMKINGGLGSFTSGESLFVLSDSSAGAVFRASLNEDELKHIRRGDSGSIVLTGESRAIDATITSISPTPNADGGFDVTTTLPQGNWEPGTNGKITVTRKTASYSMCVSNSAVRKDNRGNFVLVVRETKSVLGIQTMAERVGISVLERDGSRCAIEGPLDRNDLIIVGGNKPVSAGDRIRLEQE